MSDASSVNETIVDIFSTASCPGVSSFDRIDFFLAALSFEFTAGLEFLYSCNILSSLSVL
jgi:hypothetical protein